MAYDKVVDSAVLDAGLTSIADEIRAKGGTTDTMSFPDGMVNAIAAIETGGSAYKDLATNLITSRSSITDDTYGTIVSSILDGATKIEGGAFRDTNLETIDIPNTIKTIADYAFAYNTTLTSVTFEEPSSLTSIGSQCFYSCTNLTNVNFANTYADTVPLQCFAGCKKLQSVVFPSTVKSVSYYVISNSGVKFVRFNSTPTSISSSAFTSASSLTDIYVPWSSGAVANAPWGATNATIHYNS